MDIFSFDQQHDNTGTTLKYREAVGKDINGNIINIQRNGDQNVDSYLMDNLRFDYKNGGNKLDRVRELYTNSAAYSNDLEQQEIGNYTYDKIGNLISDVQEGITGIFWNVYGKIREIRKGSTVIKYRYDAAGNRVYKEESGPGGINATWYVRDAQGNVLSTYEGILTQTIKESYIYGSSRLGSYTWNSGGGTPSRSYEISNYLGNVMATIGDGQIPRMNGSLIDYYDADIQTATDYYSYGMVMPGRSFNAGSYRYGFNGQEMSNEIKGVGNSYTAEFWEYDPRLGRRWNVDPVVKEHESPYAAFANNPISFIDPNGADTSKPKTLIGKLDDLLSGGKAKNDEKIQMLQAGARNHAEEVLKNRALKQNAFNNMMGSELGSTEALINSDLYAKYATAEDEHTKALTWMLGQLYRAERHDDNIQNYNNYINSQQNVLLYGSSAMLTAATFIPSGGASSGLFASSTEITASLFSLHGGYGLFGKGGLRIGGYKLEAMYANEVIGTGTFFSIKQIKQGGNLLRWDYGVLHRTARMGVHSTFRFNIGTRTFGSASRATGQKPWFAPFKFWKYPKP